MRVKIDWASLIVGSKFTIFALFCFVFEGNFPSASPPGAYIWGGDLTEGFLRYRFGGLIFGGAYFRNFTVVLLDCWELDHDSEQLHVCFSLCSSSVLFNLNFNFIILFDHVITAFIFICFFCPIRTQPA